MNDHTSASPTEGPIGRGRAGEGWVTVRGRLPVQVRFYPDGEVLLWTRLTRSDDVRLLFSQVRTFLQNRVDVIQRKLRDSRAAPVDERQYRLFGEVEGREFGGSRTEGMAPAMPRQSKEELGRTA